MSMMGIGMWELLAIGGIALVFIGPEKFPDFAKIVIRTVRDLRGYVDDVKSEVISEIKPLKQEIHKLSRIDPEKYIDALVGGNDTDEDDDDIDDEDVEEENDAESHGAMGDPYFEYAPSPPKDSAVVDEETEVKASDDEADSDDGGEAEDTVEKEDSAGDSEKPTGVDDEV